MKIMKISTPKERCAIPSEDIERMQRIDASDNYKQLIYEKFYSDYTEKPYISKDRELNTNWLEQIELFPAQSLVSKSMMTRYNDGLLPGHVYMLHWLKKYTNKHVPVYFEYRYGINFEKEKIYLIKNGYLKDNKPTEKGEQALLNHRNVVENHVLDSGHNRYIQEAMKSNPSSEPSKDMVDNNLRGIGFEKQKNIEAAIRLYEYNVEHGFEGSHPYERLVIIYRRLKDYDNEIRIIKSALCLYSNHTDSREWYEKRLNKAEKLKLKESLPK